MQATVAVVIQIYSLKESKRVSPLPSSWIILHFKGNINFTTFPSKESIESLIANKMVW